MINTNRRYDGFVYSKNNGSMFTQVLTLILAFLGLVLTVVSLLNRHWRVNDIEGLVVENVRRSAGLWYKCTEEISGQISCEDIEKFWAALPMPILCGRIFFIISTGCSAFSVIFLYIGSSFTSFYAKKSFNPINNWFYKYTATRAKKKMFIVGGLLNMLAALFTAITVIWYMVLVADQYFQQEMLSGGTAASRFSQGQRFIWGYGLYLGWGAFVLQFISVLTCCCSIFDGDDEDEEGFHYGLADKFMSNEAAGRPTNRYNDNNNNYGGKEFI